MSEVGMSGVRATSPAPGWPDAVSPGPDLARLALHADASARAAIESVLGVEMPTTPLSSRRGGGRTVLHLAPDEWLVLSEPGSAPALVDALYKSVSAPMSAVDVSDRQLPIAVSGANAEALLNAGCPLDLSLAAFPVGMATRTLFGKAGVVLWRTAEAAFHMEVWRSFHDYCLQVLQLAALDLDAEVAL